jgi:hypothetical protein
MQKPLNKNGMSTSPVQYDSIEKLILETDLKITGVHFDVAADGMFISLNNSHSIVDRISKYKRLANAREELLVRFELIAEGKGIHWPELDEDLSLKGFLNDYLKQKVLAEKELLIA